MITQAAELQRVIDGEPDPAQEFVLAPGDYHIHGNEDYRTFHLSSVDPYAHRIYVHEIPLKVGGNSKVHDLTFHAADDIAIMLLDHSSRAKVYDNFLNAPTAWHGAGEVAEFERKGYGILTTDDSISEDNWNAVISGNEFRWFKAGIEVRAPGPSPINGRVKGTGKWQIRNNGFDGCEIGLRLVCPIIFNIEANHIQLHKVGIQVEGGHSCWLDKNDFERGYGDYDIEYDAKTCHMLAIGNTPPPERVNGNVHLAKMHNIYARPLRKLNIWSPCDKGEDA